MPTSYPTSSDLSGYLAAAGLTVSAALSALLGAAAASGVDVFEQRVGRRMLANAAAEEWPFDPPTNLESVLYLPQIDLAAAPTSVVYQPYGASAETLTAGLDYSLEPATAVQRGKPYEKIRFQRRWTQPLLQGQRQSLLITGRFGYGTSIPDLAFNGMLARGAWEMWPHLVHGITGGLVSWKEADASETYGELKPLDYLRMSWGDKDGEGGMFGAAVQAYWKGEI